MSIAESYQLRDATKEDIPLINTFLENNFHPEETILNALLKNENSKINQADSKQMIEDQRNIISAMISKFPCQVVLLRESGKIVGTNVMTISENKNFNDHFNVDYDDVYVTHKPKCKLLVDYFNYMNAMIDEAQLFDKVYPRARRALEFYAVAVDKDHRGKGLSTYMLQEGIICAKKNGIDLAYGLFTSSFSKRAVEKVGMKNVFELDLLKYRDSCDRIVFRDSVPHNVATVMAILIN